MNTTEREKSVKELLLGKSWKFLNDNFHKFREDRKIKIALVLVSKDIPQEIKGMNLQQQVVMMGEVKKDECPVRFDIGGAEDAIQKEN